MASEYRLVEDPPGLLFSFPLRAVSFALAALMSALVLVYPTPLAGVGKPALVLLFWGVAAGFTHGVGYRPVHRPFRLLLGPGVAWLVVPPSFLWFVPV
jgi:predicted membrane protein